MAKVFANVLRKIIVQGGAGVIFGIQTGIRQSLIATKNEIVKAVGIGHAVIKAVVNEINNGTEQTVITTGSTQLNKATGTVHSFSFSPDEFEASPAQEMTQIDIANTTGYDPSGSVGYAVGGDNDWADVANMDGRDEPEASITGGKGVGSLTEKGGGVRCPFIDPNSGKDNQTITSVELRCYLRQTGTLLGNGTLTWRLSGAISRALGAETGDVDQEYVYDLTADVGGDWNKLRGLNFEVEGSSALLGRSCFARRAYITVVSNRTITL